jgi:hypothetical protein
MYVSFAFGLVICCSVEFTNFFKFSEDWHYSEHCRVYSVNYYDITIDAGTDQA